VDEIIDTQDPKRGASYGHCLRYYPPYDKEHKERIKVFILLFSPFQVKKRYFLASVLIHLHSQN
jgi:hypothetical protein